MSLRRPESLDGFQKTIQLDAWGTQLSTFAVIYGHLASRLMQNEALAERFLTDAERKLKDAWPYPVVEFLRGQMKESALLDLATDKQTMAHCNLGLWYLAEGRREVAREHFQWVWKNGNKRTYAYGIALGEQRRLE